MVRRKWWLILLAVAITLGPSALLARGRGRSNSNAAAVKAKIAALQKANAAEAAALQKDQDEVTAAQTAFDAATVKVDNVVAKLKQTFEDGEEWKSAVAAREQTHTTYEATRKAALDALTSKPEYRKAKADCDAAEATCAKLRQESAGPDQLAPAAKLVMAKGSVVSDMENQVLANDAAFNDAKTKSTAAGAKVQELYAKFLESIKTNPEWQSAKQEKDSASEKLAAAEATLKAELAKVETYTPP